MTTSMHIQSLTLRSRNLEEQRTLWVDELGFAPLESNAQRLRLRIGDATLNFERDPSFLGTYHYALRIPEHQFAEAREWLRARVPLLTDSAGRDSFHFEAWNAHGVYFADADGNIAELIARHALQDTSLEPFDARSVCSIAEIGCVALDVPESVKYLERAYGLRPHLNQTHPEFTALGDASGLLIVVRAGRPWLPTGAPAVTAPFTAELLTERGVQRLTFELGRIADPD